MLRYSASASVLALSMAVVGAAAGQSPRVVLGPATPPASQTKAVGEQLFGQPASRTESGAASVVAQSTSQSPAGTTTAQPKNDYSKGDTWLCKPGRQDACAVDLSTTIVAGSGKLTREDWKPNPNPEIDCFGRRLVFSCSLPSFFAPRPGRGTLPR